MNLRLIKGIQKEKPDYYNLYTEAFMNCLQRAIEEIKAVIDIDLVGRKRLVYYGVKMINHYDTDGKNHEQLCHHFEKIDFIRAVITTLTPNEFENIFPIEKKYNGEKSGWKDYFYTKGTINEIGEDKAIKDNLDKFIWDYQNWDVSHFMANSMSIISDIRRAEGQKGLMEEFLDEKNVPYYMMHTDKKGKGYLENSQTGEVTKVQKPKPRYLNVVK